MRLASQADIEVDLIQLAVPPLLAVPLPAPLDPDHPRPLVFLRHQAQPRSMTVAPVRRAVVARLGVTVARRAAPPEDSRVGLFGPRGVLRHPLFGSRVLVRLQWSREELGVAQVLGPLEERAQHRVSREVVRECTVLAEVGGVGAEVVRRECVVNERALCECQYPM